MKPLVRNIFLLFGIAAIVVMMLNFHIDYASLKHHLLRAGFYFPAVVGVWIIVYAFNALAFKEIVNSGSHSKHLSFRNSYKLTVSGFAFSYTTPFGFGGGPYRMLELKSYIGTTDAMSSVVLYSMMHICSHFCLWGTSVILFVFAYTEKMTPFLWVLFSVFVAIMAVILFVFNLCYKKGVIIRMFRPLLYLPLINRWSKKFYDKYLDQMKDIDNNISYLHDRPMAFYTSLAYEYLARVVNAFEYYFILLSLGINLTFLDAVLVLAFSSLIGNLLFFFPMQLGAREGGLSIIIKFLGLSAPGLGIITSLFTRLRELIWIFIGVSIVKIGNKNLMRD